MKCHEKFSAEPVAVEQPQLWPEILHVHRTEHGYGDDDLAAIAHVTPATLNELFPALFAPPRPQLRAVTPSRDQRHLA